jgi:hypothetical protein
MARAQRTPSILLVSHPVEERQVYARALRAGGYRVVTAATSGVVADHAQPAGDRTCPRCCGFMEYRHKSPVLTVEQDSREPQDRLRYLSGWFCSDPACGYQELARSRE